MNFTTWKMCEESRRGSWSSFIAGTIEIFSELGMHSREPFDTPLDHAALIAYLGLPCFGFGKPVLDETNTLQLKGRIGGLANMYWDSTTFATWSTSTSNWTARESSDTFQEDSGYGHLSVFFVKCDSDASGCVRSGLASHHGADITQEPDYIRIFSKYSIQILVSGHTQNAEAVVLPHHHDFDGTSALVVPIRVHQLPLAIECLKNSQAMFVRPASTHAFNSRWEVPSIHWHCNLGGEMLGQAAINSRPNISPCKQSLFHGRRRNESDKHGHRGMQQMPLCQIFLASLSITSGNAATL